MNQNFNIFNNQQNVYNNKISTKKQNMNENGNLERNFNQQTNIYIIILIFHI